MASTTTNFNLHKIDLTDAPPDITVLNQNWDIIDENLGGGGGILTVNATSTDGVTYTATNEKVKELAKGIVILFVPDRTSTTATPTLNINGLGAVTIRRKISMGTGTTTGGGVASWLYKDRPSLFVYDGSYWIPLDLTKPTAQDLYGSVPVENGGTGADNAEEARTNLGAEQARTDVTGTGAVTLTVEDYKEYSYTAVTSLTMTGVAVNAHGFITFGSSAPTVSVSGFTASSGDDITAAKASEIWEFSIYPHNSGSYIIWKNWSA
jgi:hypothetical protein